MGKIIDLTKKSYMKENKMFFDKEKKKSSFVPAKTPESRQKQKMAIASYYAKQNNSPKSKKNIK